MLRLITLVFITGLFLGGGVSYFGFHRNLPIPTPTPVPESGLKKAIDQALIGTFGTYGIVVKNIKTAEFYSSNSHRPFVAGSLYKLWILGKVEQEIQSGRINEQEVLTSDVASLNGQFHISSDSAELIDGVITLSVHDALNQMITISHNYAALLLTKEIKLSGLRDYLKSLDMAESHVGGDTGSPITTALDTANFLEKLYQGQLANSDRTNEMLSFLKNQILNNKLPRYLPSDITVAHKTGEIDNFTHDAGIVYSPAGDYIIVVLSESDNPDLAAERISAVSQAVYNYFNTKSP